MYMYYSPISTICKNAHYELTGVILFLSYYLYPSISYKMESQQQFPSNFIRESDVHADPSYKKEKEFFDKLGFKGLFYL